MAEFSLVGLSVVREAARLGSFSLAAEHLGYTQSAISRQVALMEQAAGRALFERHARGVQPTPAGVLLIRHAETVLEELRAARQNLQDFDRQPPRRLRVGVFSTAMAALVPRAIADLNGREPNTQVVLHEGTTPDLLMSLQRGRLDLAVMTLPTDLPDNGLEATKLLDDPLFVATAPGHPIAGHASVTPAMLKGQRWIASSSEPHSTLLGAWNESSWQPDISFVTRDWVAKLGLVAAGLGITLVPGLAVPALPQNLAVVRIDHAAAVRGTGVAYRAGSSDDRSVRVFTEALLDAAATLAAEVRHKLRCNTPPAIPAPGSGPMPNPPHGAAPSECTDRASEPAPSTGLGTEPGRTP